MRAKKWFDKIKLDKIIKMPAKDAKKSRSCAYPLLSLSEAVELAQKLYENYGVGPHSREGAARGLGYSSFSGAASGKIGALVHFGLLVREAGNYFISPLAKEIFADPGEKGIAAISIAARRPLLYSKLVGRFQGEFLPKNLPDILVSDYKITAKAAPAAADNFLRTMELAGFIAEGKLVPIEEARVSEPHQNDSDVIEETGETDQDMIKVVLPSGVKVFFPEAMAYRLALGEFAKEIMDLGKKADGVE